MRTSGQDQECRLKGVFGVVRLAENSPAHPQDRWAVAHDQCFERVFRVDPVA